MAGQQANPYLSPNQQDLLLAALSSQAKKSRSNAPAVGDTGITNNDVKRDPATMSVMFQSPANMDLNGDFTPELDYLDGDTSFDFDNADLGGEMIGALPGSGLEPEQHDKRKSPDENESPEEGDAKRQETQEGEKGAKKPGRKPLTNEPTTVSLRCFVRFANTRTPPSTQLAPVIPQSPLQTMRALSIFVLDASISQ